MLAIGPIRAQGAGGLAIEPIRAQGQGGLAIWAIRALGPYGLRAPDGSGVTSGATSTP